MQGLKSKPCVPGAHQPRVATSSLERSHKLPGVEGGLAGTRVGTEKTFNPGGATQEGTDRSHTKRVFDRLSRWWLSLRAYFKCKEGNGGVRGASGAGGGGRAQILSGRLAVTGAV